MYITISVYSALSIWVLFILLMQLVNGGQLVNITFLSVSFAAGPSVAVLYMLYFP